MKRALLLYSLVTSLAACDREAFAPVDRPARAGFVISGGGTEAAYLFPGPSSSGMAINEKGAVAGVSYGAPVPGHQSITWPEPGSRVFHGTLGGEYSTGMGINDAGTTVGFSWVAGGGDHAFVWTEATGMVQLPGLPGFEGWLSYAYGVNSRGDVVGHSGGCRAWMFVPSSPNGTAGSMRNLHAEWQRYGCSVAWDINDKGQVAGHAFRVGEDWRWRGVVWSEAEGVRELPWLGGDACADCYNYVHALNEDGDAVGLSVYGSGSDRIERAVLWPHQGGVVALSTYDGACIGRSIAWGINDIGDIVGECENKPVAWTNGRMIYLSAPQGGVLPGIARDINNLGQVTGNISGAATRWSAFQMNSAPVLALHGPAHSPEGSAVTFDVGASDPDGDPLTFSWDFGDGTTGTGAAVPVHTYVDDGTYSIVVTASDGNASTSVSTSISISNVGPAVSEIAAPVGPVPVGTSVNVRATFTDPGLGDTHSVVIDWGDGTTSAGTVSGGNGVGAVDASHSYTVAGVYTVQLSVTDKDGGMGSSTHRYVVVYDPNGGFVTGGGWIESPTGACMLPSCTQRTVGRATFGFVSRYKTGATTPTGNTEFQFRAGDLSFSSTSYEWLVVAGARAQYKGEGAINGARVYGFLLTAIDGAVAGGGGSDRFRIKIWDKSTGAVAYDNQNGAQDDSDATSELGGGSIVIHR